MQQQHEILEDPVQQRTKVNDALVLNELVQNIAQQQSTVNNERTMEENIEQDFNDTRADILSSPTATQQQQPTVYNERTRGKY